MDIKKRYDKFKKDMDAVFGLNAIQSFFGVILGIALLAFVIVIIMGTLSTSNIIATSNVAFNQSQSILLNVSSGVSSFFGSITPVYAILAVLVIILVLVVLVRVVQAPASSSGAGQL